MTSIFRQPPKLHTRVTNNIFALTIASSLMFACMTIFIIYSLEDAVFKEQLNLVAMTRTDESQLPDGYLWVNDLSKFNVSIAEQFKYIEMADEGYGEFGYAGRHYHYLKLDQGYLLLDASKLGLVSRTIDDILLVLLLAFIPAVLLAFWVASRISNHAIKPFNQVSKIFLTEQIELNQAIEATESIKESDLREMAQQWVTVLQNKADSLEREITFNQGMAHELRTPLQVMTHSTELLASMDEHLKKRPAFQRLNKSITRMKRLTDALLWLTAEVEADQIAKAGCVIENILDESAKLLDMHQISVTMDKQVELTLPMPEVVFELIVLNLLTNVIHHCQSKDDDKYWKIVVKEGVVEFSNPSVFENNEQSQSGRFGLGLRLVEKLSHKFHLRLNINAESDLFTVQLCLP